MCNLALILKSNRFHFFNKFLYFKNDKIKVVNVGFIELNQTLNHEQPLNFNATSSQET
jgi:hypothetical protein